MELETQHRFAFSTHLDSSWVVVVSPKDKDASFSCQAVFHFLAKYLSATETIYNDGGVPYDSFGVVSVQHGSLVIDNQSKVQIVSSKEGYAPNTLSIGVYGVVETHTPIEFKSYNFANVSHFNASVIFNGGTLMVGADIPASNPVFVSQANYNIPSTKYYSFKTPHIYISELGASIVTNNLNAKIDLPLEHTPDLTTADGGLRINDGESYSGSVTLCMDNSAYTDIYDPANNDEIYYQRYRGDTAISHGSLFLGDGTAGYDAPLTWNGINYSDIQIDSGATLVFYNHDDQTYSDLINGGNISNQGMIKKCGDGDLNLPIYSGNIIDLATGGGQISGANVAVNPPAPPPQVINITVGHNPSDMTDVTYSHYSYTVGGKNIFIAVNFYQAITVSSAVLGIGSGINMSTNIYSIENSGKTLIFTFSAALGKNTADLDIDSLIINGSAIDIPDAGSPYSLTNCNVAVDTRLYWTNGDGNWTIDTDNKNWRLGGVGNDHPLTAWIDGADAVFWSPDSNGAAISLNDNVNVHSITFINGDFQISNPTSSITLTGSPISLIEVDALPATIEAKITGSAGLNKKGRGTLILTANNDYVGDTIIESGTLQFGSGGPTGRVTGDGDIINNGTLIINSTSEWTFANVLKGSGSLILGVSSGSAANFILTQNSTEFTGNTILYSGILQLGNEDYTGGLNGDIHDYGSLIIYTPASSTYTYPGRILGSGDLTKDGPGTLDLDGNSTTLLRTITLNEGTITNGTLQASYAYYLLSGTMSAEMKDKGGVPDPSRLTDVFEDGLNGASTVNITTDITMPCSKLYVKASTMNAQNVLVYSNYVTDVGEQIGHLNANVTAILLEIGGLGPSVTTNAWADNSITYTIGDTIYIDLSFNNPVTVTGTPLLHLATGSVDSYATYVGGSYSNTLTFAYTVRICDNALDLDYVGSNALLLNGGTIRDGFKRDVILNLAASGQAHSLSANSNVVIDTHFYWDPSAVESGTAFWDTNTTDTYWHLGSPTGPLTAWVNGADAVFGACGDVPGTVYVEDYEDPNGPVTARSITFLQSGYVISGATVNDTLFIAANGMIVSVNGENDTATISCKLVDAALRDDGLTKTGEGKLVLTGAKSYTGDTVISEGTLQLGDGTTNGSLSSNIVNNAKLKFAEAADYLFDGDISGSGTLTVENDPSATLTLSGNLSYSGNTTVNGGVLKFTSGTGNTPLIDIFNGKAVFSTTNVTNPDLNIQTGANGTFEIADGSHVVGDIIGEDGDDLDAAGTTQVSGQLTAHSIFQDSLTILADSTATLSLATSLQLRVFVNHLNLQSTTSTLDLSNAGMIITNAIYDDVLDAIHRALNVANSGWWDGAGITSSVAKNDPNGLNCLGLLTGEEFLDYATSATQFLGKTITGHPNWILIRPTVLADSNFSGATDDADYGYINYGYGGGDIPAGCWMWGDYNYDGTIDADDYGYIDAAYGAQYQG